MRYTGLLAGWLLAHAFVLGTCNVVKGYRLPVTGYSVALSAYQLYLGRVLPTVASSTHSAHRGWHTVQVWNRYVVLVVLQVPTAASDCVWGGSMRHVCLSAVHGCSASRSTSQKRSERATESFGQGPVAILPPCTTFPLPLPRYREAPCHDTLCRANGGGSQLRATAGCVACAIVCRVAVDSMYHTRIHALIGSKGGGRGISASPGSKLAKLHHTSIT